MKAWASLLAVVALPGTDAPPRTLRLDAAAPFVDAVIAKRPVRLRVDLAGPRDVIVDLSTARRLGLASPKRELLELVGWDAGGTLDLRIGPVSLPGRWTGTGWTVDGIRRDGRVLWFPHDQDDGADGVIGPALLPYDEVVLVRRPRTALDRTVEVPVRSGRWRGIEAEHVAGGRRIEIGWSLERSSTLATAAAGRALADAGAGVMTGARARASVAFGVDRPVRTVRLARPLDVGGFRLDAFLIRVSDYAGEGQPPPDAELPPDEVHVEARGERQRAWSRLTIGSDLLAACAEIAWRRRPATMRLTCTP